MAPHTPQRTEIRVRSDTRRLLTLLKARLECELGDTLSWDELVNLLASRLPEPDISNQATTLQRWLVAYRRGGPAPNRRGE